jgi:methyl-accepting chemotaxis protein
MTLFSQARAALGRLRLGHQLHGAFAVVLLLTAAVGGLGLYSLARVDDQAQALSGKWLQGVGHLAAARAAVLESRDFEVKHSRATDRSYHAEYEDKLKQAAAAVSTTMKAYEGLVDGEAETKHLATFNKSWAGYQQAQQKVVALGRDQKAQDAADISDGAASMAIDEAIGALDRLTKHNFEGGTAAAESTHAVYARARLLMLGLLATALLLGLALAYAITRRLIRQLGGEPAAAAAFAQLVAEGDLRSQIDLRAGDTHSLMARLQAMQLALREAVSAVRQGSESVAAASAQIAHGNQDLSRRTEQQASALQQTAATMDELGSTVRNNADNAKQANQLALGASTVATKGGQVVGQVVETMKGINDSSRKIADIISVIDGIAFQTNILALNAAVEAARAGEQGRGFAVVAAEVRSLAQRSAEAAKEIKALITASVDRVEHGSTLVDQAGMTMGEIVGAIKRVTDIVGEISAASVEQSSGVAQVGQAVSQMDQATQQNAALVEQSASAAMSLQQQAQQLVQAVAVFKLSHGHAPPHAAAAPDRLPAVERRSPNRATNVERLKPAAKRAAVKHSSAAATTAAAATVTTTTAAATPAAATSAQPAMARTGSDDWESF